MAYGGNRSTTANHRKAIEQRGYGDIPSEEYSIEAIRKAYDFGCTFFDTAEAYGPNMLRENRGHNERIVGKALNQIPVQGYRGFEEFDGGSMANWGKKK